MHQPVIGAINGPAIGGGLCLSLAFEIMLTGRDVDAAEAARIGLVSRVTAHGPGVFVVCG